MHKVTVGNVSVFVEVRPYDGVCEHCGKTGIKYLAHVQQNVAQTIKAGIEDRSQKIDYTAAMFGGKANCEVEVGCVCVAKYLKSNSVEDNLAQRVQRKVNSLTSSLILAGKLAEATSTEALEAYKVKWNLTRAVLAKRDSLYQKCIAAYSSSKTNLDEALIAERDAAVKMANEVLHRLHRETFSFSFWKTRGAKTADEAAQCYVAHIIRKQTKVQRVLDRFTDRTPDRIRRFV